MQAMSETLARLRESANVEVGPLEVPAQPPLSPGRVGIPSIPPGFTEYEVRPCLKCRRQLQWFEHDLCIKCEIEERDL